MKKERQPLRYMVGSVLKMRRYVAPHFLIDSTVVVIETGAKLAYYRYKVRDTEGHEGWVYEDDLKGALE